MATTNEYKIAFRGYIIKTIKSVYPSIHIVVGHPKPTDSVRVLRSFQTAPTARMEARRVARSGGEAYVLRVTPGLTEITEAEILFQYNAATVNLVVKS